MTNEEERMPQKSVMQWVQEWYKLMQGGETSRPSVYPIRIEGLDHTTNVPQEFTVEFIYSGAESSALDAVNAALNERGIVNVAEVKETKMTVEELTKLVADKLQVGSRSRERSEELAQLWFETKNPMLGELSPNELIELGKLNKVVEFVNSAE